VPVIRPFRALRYETDSVTDLRAVVSPPYDVIDTTGQRALLTRHPRNVVRLELPPDEVGDEPDARYRRAARTFAAWRSDGTFHKDPRPSLYAYEQDYQVPGTDVERTQRGFFGRLRLEPYGPGSGVLPHERTLAAPREDRYRLLRATGANMSPVVALYEDRSGRTSAVLARVSNRRPDADVIDDDGVRHRLWVIPSTAPIAERPTDQPVPDTDELVAAASAGPVTIADGHHRYETALRYRDERRMTRSCEEDPAFDYVLTLFLETSGQPLTVLPTHRVLLGLTEDAAAGLIDRGGALFDVRPTATEEAVEAFGSTALAGGTGGRGRFGLVTRSGSAVLHARPGAFAPWLPAGGEAVRRLDVTLLGTALERLVDLDAEGVASGGRIAYTKSAVEAAAWVRDRHDGADAAFLLEPTPVSDIVAVAREGDVMPQKSTYFYPKALTGLVINPHEW
jgi:uncharacterized protein (DUF1015 family)